MSRSKRTPRERIERAFHVSFLLPAQAAELLDDYAAQVREETLAEAVAMIQRLPPLLAAGVNQHWYRFGQNRAASAMQAACKAWKPAKAPGGSQQPARPLKEGNTA